MSQLTNDDVFSCMLSYLDINTIENLSESTEDNKKIVDKFQHIYYKNHLVQIWGQGIIEILEKTEDNLKRDIKEIYNIFKIEDMYSVSKILYKFYECVSEDKIVYNNDTFMFIYDLTYTNISSENGCPSSHSRIPLLEQREKFMKDNNIEDGKKYHFITKSTSYIDRWVVLED